MNEKGFQFLSAGGMAAMATPFRQQLLAALAEPDSAANLARRFGMSRQRIGYHMRELERAGCIELTGERQQRGLTERLFQVRPLAFVLGPERGAASVSARERFSWAALLSLMAGVIWDLVRLRARADAAGKRLATLALEAEVAFASPRARRAFTEDLLKAVQETVARHHDPEAAEGRRFRVVVGALPVFQESPSPDGATKQQQGSVGHDHTKH